MKRSVAIVRRVSGADAARPREHAWATPDGRLTAARTDGERAVFVVTLRKLG